MFLCSLIEELCTKEENDKTGCNFNFGHVCIISGIESFVLLNEYILQFKLCKIVLDFPSIKNPY